MSLLKKLFNKRLKEGTPADTAKEPPANYKKEIEDSSEITDDERIQRIVNKIAIRKDFPSGNNSEFNSSQGNLDIDISAVTLDKYSAVEMPEETGQRIKNLQKIVRSIENKCENFEPQYIHKPEYKIDYSKALNPQQLAAVVTLNGPVLVIAGAGSGKTRVIVHRVSYMLENGVDPQKILLLTFTRKAAREMLSRVSELLQNNSVNKIMGGTFHAFSNYVLRRYANLLRIQSGFTIIDAADAEDTIDLIRTELHYNKTDKAFPKKSRIQEIIRHERQ